MERVTKIEIQKRNKERVNLFLDNEYAFSLSVELVYKEGLKVGQEIDINRLKSIAQKETFIRCKDSALKIIERNYKTEKEVRDKLKLKGFEDDAIDNSMDFLKNYNFINDNNYAESFIKDKLNSQGRQKIKYNLIKKGISQEIIEEKLYCIDKEDEKTAALNLAGKKLKIIKKSENDNYKINGKLYRFLISKGYGYDVVRDVVKEVLQVDDFE